MGDERPEALTLINFSCRADFCGQKFRAPPGRIEEHPQRPTHPWAYFAACPKCGEEASQAAWEIGLLNQLGKHTGPKTPEGIAATTANLAGHPTQEEAQRTRFNAMKHGLFARTATYFPARPGKYSQCDGCEYEIDQGCIPFGACVKRTELFMQHHIAFETKNPELLTSLRAETHAGAHAMMTDMLRAIFADGVSQTIPKMYYDKDGKCHVFKYKNAQGEEITVDEISAHPLIKHFFDGMAKMGITLNDLAMTPRVQNDEEMIKGHLDVAHSEQANLLEFQKQVSTQLGDLRGMIQRGRERIARDPVLIEQQASERE